MPPFAPDIVDNLLQYTKVAATTLQDVSDAANIPYLRAVSGVSVSIIAMVQDVKTNKDRCLRMTEKIHHVLCALTTLCLNSEHITTPKLLDQIGGFAEALQKFHGCLRSQQELGKIMRFFKQSEITAQLETCEGELKTVLDAFTMRSGAGVAAAMVEMNVDMEQRHQELLELIASTSDAQSSETASSIRSIFLHASNSSGAFSVLPAFPQIFHGRESELQHVVTTLLGDPARIAILGAGGMGKTTLATAALHHPTVEQKYRHRHFVPCESANSSADLVAILGSHLHLEPSKKLSKMIVSHFTDCGPAVLLLDNLETPWEPAGSRFEVEEFLSLLTDVPHLALLITMRGAERPGKVKWTRPFLPPLEPLSLDASRQTFVEIADNPTDDEEPALVELLGLTGNLPLAVSLMANVASSEGYSGALSRWKMENWALLSHEWDKRSNLDKSIIMSLTSPRIASSPHALELLSLLSLLPDGIFEEELLASNVPIPGIRECRVSLLRTSLAYMANGRLKALSPICEYMQRVHYPSHSLVRPLRRHFCELLMLWKTHKQLPSREIIPQLIPNLGNIHSLMFSGFDEEIAELKEICYTILTLDSFSSRMLRGQSPLLEYLPALIQSIGDPQLQWDYVCSRLETCPSPISAVDAELLIPQGIQYFVQAHDSAGEAQFYNALTRYYALTADLQKILHFNNLAMSLDTAPGNANPQISAALRRAGLEFRAGNYHESIQYAQKSEAIARIWGYCQDECEGLLVEAIARCQLGNLSQALKLCKQARELLTANGLSGSVEEIGVLDAEAEIHFQKSQYAQARKLNEVVTRMAAPNRSMLFRANALSNLAQIDIIIGGENAEILGNLNTAQDICDKIEWADGLTFCKMATAGLDLQCGQITNACVSYKHCLSVAGNTTRMLLCLEYLGDPIHTMNDAEDTFHWAGTYFSLARKTKNLGHTYQSLRCLGDIFLAQGEEETALNVFRAVLDGSTEMDVHRRRADCMSRIGDILMCRGDAEEARKMWEDARPLFVRSSQVKDVTAIDTRLAQLAGTNLVSARI